MLVAVIPTVDAVRWRLLWDGWLSLQLRSQVVLAHSGTGRCIIWRRLFGELR